MAEDGEFDFIVHGCNCFNTMRSGIAGQLARKYPEVVRADNETQKGDASKLGTFTLATIMTSTSMFTVVNAYTQYTYDATRTVFKYDSFEKFLGSFAEALIAYSRSHDAPMRVGFPHIGAGLAGGDWDLILPMICDFSKKTNGSTKVTVVEYKK